ncbi:MAG: cation:proton antiporter [Acidimicrobiia bacterium]
MEDLSFGSVAAVAAIALIAPLLVSLAPRLRVPAVVLEILLGVLVGPSLLGWVEVEVPLEVLSIIGLSFLLFLGGLELDLGSVRSQGARIVVAYGFSAALALAAGALISIIDDNDQAVFVAIALASTSLGLVVPVLRDAGASFTPLGQLTLAASSVGEFGAVLGLALFYSEGGARIESQILLLVAFSILVVAVAWTFTRVQRSPRFSDTLLSQEETSSQLGVRIAMLVMAVFVALSTDLGFEAVLGAFVAGALLRITDPDERLTHARLRSKLDAIGYGFLVPAFFVTTGIQLDMEALFADPSSLVLVPILLVAFLIVRGVPALLYRGLRTRAETAAVGLLQATTLSVPVVAARVGVELGTIDSDTAAAIVVAGLLTVVLFPPIALTMLGRAAGADDPKTRQESEE